MAKFKGLDGLENTPFEIIFEPDDEGVDAPIVVVSQPPAGSYRVCNIYVNELGKLVIKYSDVAIT